MKQRWFGVMVVGGMVAVMTPLIVLASGGSGGSLLGNQHGFEAVVHAIEERYQIHATKIPFMGLMSGIARISTHGGVSGMHVANFEHFDKQVDGEELNRLVTERAGTGWSRMVRETSRDGDDQSLIFVRAEGSRMGMLVVDLSGHEMDVVQMSLNPEQLARQMEEHHHGGKHSPETVTDDQSTDEAKSE